MRGECISAVEAVPRHPADRPALTVADDHVVRRERRAERDRERQQELVCLVVWRCVVMVWLCWCG